MKWFEGGIAEAIAESRQRKALFIVNIQFPAENGDEESVRMANLWDTVDNDIFKPALVGIRIFHGTESAKQFAQIYPVPVVPASYIIDLKGRPLDVITITEEMDEDVFIHRLKIAMKTLHETGQASSSTSATNNIPSMEAITKKPESATETMEEKMKRTRELLEKKHAEDEVLKRNEEQRKEIERRNLGKLMAEAKATREERERREIAGQRKREKREQEAYLRRLREQIKADKEERINGMMRNVMEPKQETKPAQQQASMQSSLSNSAECRIQCKFPDGSTLVHQFASTDTFSQLIEIIKTDGRQGDDFYLVQMYPRREFSDITQTFAELGLTPSATILVVSKRKRTIANYGGSRWIEFIQYAIVAPFQALYHLLLYVVGYGGAQSQSFGTATKSASGTNAPSRAGIVEESDGNHRGYVRQDGNLRRFHNEEDSSHSDDEARWNGNSTQQL